MRRAVLAVLAVIVLAGCTPAEWAGFVSWAQDTHDQAVAEAQPCPEYAVDLAWRGLPDAFGYIMWRESRCDPSQVNPASGSAGLTQIMPFWLGELCPAGIACTEADLLNAEANLDAAAYVYAAQGLDAWATS